MSRNQLRSPPSMPEPRTDGEDDLNAPSDNTAGAPLTTTASYFFFFFFSLFSSPASSFATTTNTNAVLCSSNADSTLTCPYCDRNFTPRIGLAGHLQLCCTETGEPVSVAPTGTVARSLSAHNIAGHSSTAYTSMSTEVATMAT
ncbi:hypothetical protein SprV_0100311100 [Sparganum proliferum]